MMYGSSRATTSLDAALRAMPARARRLSTIGSSQPIADAEASPATPSRPLFVPHLRIVAADRHTDMVEFTKRERQELRRLAGAAYEAEARTLLKQLDGSFQEWRSKRLTNSELLEAIQDFHQHVSRDLWSVYRTLADRELVVRGLARGFVAEADVQAALLAKLQPLTKLLSR